MSHLFIYRGISNIFHAGDQHRECDRGSSRSPDQRLSPNKLPGVLITRECDQNIWKLYSEFVVTLISNSRYRYRCGYSAGNCNLSVIYKSVVLYLCSNTLFLLVGSLE